MSLKLFFAVLSCFVFFQNGARAEVVYTTVFNVFESKKTETILVLSGIDGRVYKTHKNEENLKRMKSLQGQVVRLEYQVSGPSAIITNIQLANSTEVNAQTLDLNHFRYNQLREFAPTDLQSVEKVTEVFNKMLNDGDKNRSQCFKRAHMWSFDMWSKNGINSEKIFIFYTKRYMIVDEFDWWFHVAPMVTAGGVEYVLDGTFMKKPVTVEEWKNYFMKTEKINCPTVEKYQDYENNQWTKLCYFMKVPMYHFRPLDIETRDKQGLERNHWLIEELQDARKAFKNWEENYEGLDTGAKTIKY